MNYLKIYIDIVKRAEQRKSLIGYTEKHHVFPQCVFGKNDRIVELTAREHILCHYLLYKRYLKRESYSENTRKLGHAFRMMTFQTDRLLRKPSIRYLAMCREINSRFNIGDLNPAKRDEVREKIRLSKLGKERVDMKNKSYFGSDKDVDDIIIKAQKTRRKVMDENFEKTGKYVNYPQERKGVPCSEEKAEKISKARKNTLQKYKDMSDKEFEQWLLRYYNPNKRNCNITRALKARGLTYEDEYVKNIITNV